MQEDVEKKVTKKRKEDYFDVENLEDLENIINNFLENKIDPSKQESLNFLLYPNSTFKKFWDLLIVIILLYICSYFPYHVCFNVQDDVLDIFFWFEFLIDVIFLCDIFINF